MGEPLKAAMLKVTFVAMTLVRLLRRTARLCGCWEMYPTRVMSSEVLCVGLSGFQSTLTVLVSRPSIRGLTVRLIVTCAPLARLPNSHVTTPEELLQVPWPVETEMNSASAGKVSVT